MCSFSLEGGPWTWTQPKPVSDLHDWLWSQSAAAAVPESPAAVYCIMGSYYVMSPPRCAGRHAVLIVKTIAFLAASENPPATSNCHCGCQAVKERESRGAAPLSILKSRFFKFLFQHFLFHFFSSFYFKPVSAFHHLKPSFSRHPLSLVQLRTPKCLSLARRPGRTEQESLFATIYIGAAC